MSHLPADFTGFRPAALGFFRDLSRNNRKEWFEAHRDVYENEVRAPLRALLEAVDFRLATIAPELTADMKRSIFRLNRDIRFSKDKSPYKAYASFWVNHRRVAGGGGPQVHGGAGLYFHVQPRASIVAAGIGCRRRRCWPASAWHSQRTAAASTGDARAAQTVGHAE